MALAKHGKHIKDPDRVRVAEWLISTPAELLEVNARKLRRMFSAELESVVSTGGKCPGLLWTQIAIWCEAESIPSDTHFIEGINNMIILTARDAPVMKDPLLSSRVQGRLALLPDQGERSRHMDHASVKDMMGPIAKVADAAVQFLSGANVVMSDIHRFETPAPAAPVSKAAIATYPAAYQTSVMEWARHYNAKAISQTNWPKGG